MADRSASPLLPPNAAAQLSEFARTCKAAARAVSLYPASHPTIAASLTRLAEITSALTAGGPFRLQILSDRLLVDGARLPRTDVAVAEFAALLHRHLIGALTLNPGAAADSWHTLLLLLSRTPEEVRGDGGIARLWATAGGPSIEIQEIDYAELLREKEGLASTIDEILARALAGPRLDLDESGMRLLLDIVSDPSKLDVLMTRLEHATSRQGASSAAGAFLTILKGLTDYLSRTAPEDLPAFFQQMGRGARKLSADNMLALLAGRGRADAVVGNINVISAVIDGMADESVAGFVAGSVIAERGASERLAHAFRALVPEIDRQRQLLALAREEVAGSELGGEENFAELWERVEVLLTSYSDANFVSTEYARELSAARAQPTDVERASDDPPERIAVWLSTVSDAALRMLDRDLLVDLLAIEADPLRWRDVADTTVEHAEDLVRVGYFDQAWQLVETVASQGKLRPERRAHASTALERFGRSSMLKHVATHLRSTGDESVERFTRLCHEMGAPVIAPLAEVLSAEQDARARRRLRDILVGFGSQGRESVQQLMHAPNWEVRRTAAYLLREFGGAEGLQELIPLLTDQEPLVQREAVQGLVFNGSPQAADILLRALNGATGRTVETLVNELGAIRDDRGTSFFSHLVRHVDRRALPKVYATAIEALGASKNDDAVAALVFALEQGDWRRPFSTRRFRAAAAQSLRRIGTPAARDALDRAASHGPIGARWAARAEVRQLE